MSDSESASMESCLTLRNYVDDAFDHTEKTARFTNYSMSSSVIPRSEGTMSLQ